MIRPANRLALALDRIRTEHRVRHQVERRTRRAENVTARALGVKPQLRVIEGGQQRDIRRSLDEAVSTEAPKTATI